MYMKAREFRNHRLEEEREKRRTEQQESYDFDKFVEIIAALQEKVTIHVSDDDKTIAKRPT